MAEKEKGIMKKKTVKLVSAVVALGVVSGAYVGVNSSGEKRIRGRGYKC